MIKNAAAKSALNIEYGTGKTMLGVEVANHILLRAFIERVVSNILKIYHFICSKFQTTFGHKKMAKHMVVRIIFKTLQFFLSKYLLPV